LQEKGILGKKKGNLYERLNSKTIKPGGRGKKTKPYKLKKWTRGGVGISSGRKKKSSSQTKQ